MTEARWQARVEEHLRRYGYRLIYHTHDSRRSAPGFPDLVAVKPGRLAAIECKTDTGVVSTIQAAWIAALATVPGVVAMIARPRDEQTLVDLLAGRVAA